MRLTNEIRDNAITNILKKKIIAQVEKIRLEVLGIVQEEANKIYKGKVKEWIDLAPRGGLMMASEFHIKSGNKCFYHELLGGGRWGVRLTTFKLKKSIKVLKQDEYNEEINVSEKSKNGKRLKKIYSTLNDIDNQKTELEKTIRSALYGCTTRKQLVDNYPDLASYVPLMEKKTKALAVTNSEVRKVLA